MTGTSRLSGLSDQVRFEEYFIPASRMLREPLERYLSRSTLLKDEPPRSLKPPGKARRRSALTWGLRDVDCILGDFACGDFAVFYGSHHAVQLSLILSVRAQLPLEEGGLDSAVIYADGGNSFNPYTVTSVATALKIDPRSVLRRLLISRAFTAHQLESLLFERLEEAVERWRSRVVVVSDVMRLYLDSDVSYREAGEAFNGLTRHLSRLASEKQIVLLATATPFPNSKRGHILSQYLLSRASILLRLEDKGDTMRITIERHPRIDRGYFDTLSIHPTSRRSMGELLWSRRVGPIQHD